MGQNRYLQGGLPTQSCAGPWVMTHCAPWQHTLQHPTSPAAAFAAVAAMVSMISPPMIGRCFLMVVSMSFAFRLNVVKLCHQTNPD
jgi:hypothetical protein